MHGNAHRYGHLFARSCRLRGLHNLAACKRACRRRKSTSSYELRGRNGTTNTVMWTPLAQSWLLYRDAEPPCPSELSAEADAELESGMAQSIATSAAAANLYSRVSFIVLTYCGHDCKRATRRVSPLSRRGYELRVCRWWRGTCIVSVGV